MSFENFPGVVMCAVPGRPCNGARHSAAVHRVTAWYRCDADWNDLLPELATCRGRSANLTMTQKLLAEASRRFEAFAQWSRHD
jgi:hypothetical protein